MKTLILKPDEIDQAAQIIKNGGIVAMPTETVYGLAANALDGKAVAQIFKAKGRPMDNPLIVHVADVAQAKTLVRSFPREAEILAEKFWPGPLTIILPKADIIPDEVSAGLDTVAVRIPFDPIARKLISLSCPLAAPSANLSGSPSPTSVKHVIDDMDGRIDAIIDGGDCEVGVESTVITLAGDRPRLLRPGGITVEQLREVIGEVEIDDAVVNPLKDGVKAASPGMKYKHYSPKATVILLRGTSKGYVDYVNSHNDGKTAALCYHEETESLNIPYIVLGAENDQKTQAHNLFTALRQADELGIETVYAHCPNRKGVGLAIYNRIIRAAGFEIIEV